MKNQDSSRSTLRARSEFERVFKDGKRFFRDGLGFCVLKTDETAFKFAVSVSKRFGNAVLRNQLRRRVREIIRTNDTVPKSAIVVISVKKPCKTMGFVLLKSACEWAFARINAMPDFAVSAAI